MSETNSESTQQPSKRLPNEPRPSRFPKIMVVVTLLVVIAIVLIHRVFLFEIQEITGQGKDILNIVTYLLILLTFVSWVITLAFLNRWRMKSRVVALLMLFSLPAVFFALGPVFGGDIGFLRFEPFWMAKPKPVEVEAVEVDLATETPFDFPRFMGPEQDGQAARGISLNPDGFEDAKRVWTLPIGEGWSGFTARNGFAVTMEQRGIHECVSCYEVKTGKLAWIYKHEARHQDFADLGHEGPRSTPAIHDGNVYAMGAVGNLVCLDGNNGSVIWQQNLNPILNIQLAEAKSGSGHTIQWEENTSLSWGRSGSPLIVDDLVVVPGGGPQNQAITLLAFNRMTGEPVWQGGSEMIAYGSPVLATVSAQRQILIVAETKVMGFDPTSGDVLWSHPRPGASDAMANCSQPTVVSDSYILTSKGYNDGGGELLALNISENGLKPESIWSNPRVLKTKFTNPIIFDGHAYSISSGLLECTNLAKGKRVWKHRKRLENGQILKVGNYILTHSESGGYGQSMIHLVEPSPNGYSELGSFRTVKGTCWNNLCIYENYLLVRSEREAACFELPINGSAF